MTHETRWLNELDVDAKERELLVAGRSDLPSPEVVRRSFVAFAAALGTTSASAYAGATAVETAKAVGATTTTLASTSSLLTLAVKPILLGFVLGSSLLGAATLIDRPTSAPIAAPPTAVRERTASSPVAFARETQALTTTEPAIVEPPVILQPTTAPAIPPTRVAPSVIAESEPTLAEQARELAHIKRLLSRSLVTEALAQLKRTESAFDQQTLVEEREALYIEALLRNGQAQSARERGERFIERFPNSPYRGKIRELISEE